ncbi:MAG: hypothetical protein U9Q79_11525, partial [Candidatus Hydrogenedentes bacterium]|nr:hypothetical protein [Candidatus Hydrogenedentota bacterium]
MKRDRDRTRVIGAAIVTAAGVAAFTAAIELGLLRSGEPLSEGFGVYVQTVVLPLTALVAAMHLLLFAAFRAALGERFRSAPWRLGMALAVALGIFQLGEAMAGAANAVLPLPWALPLVSAALSALCGLAIFAVLNTLLRQRVLGILLVALVATSICVAAYRTSLYITRENVASASHLDKAGASGQAFSEDAIVDYAETFVSG